LSRRYKPPEAVDFKIYEDLEEPAVKMY